MTTPIREIKLLKRDFRVLETLGYDTVEHFIGAATPTGHPLAPYLGERTAAILDELTGGAPPPPAFDATKEFPLGTTLNRIPSDRLRHGSFLNFEAATLKSEVNLIEPALPIRDQGNKRGTCVAHATVACYEYFLLLKRKLLREMSEQFINFLCKENDNTIEGTFLGVSFPKLDQLGCCLEETWPYNPDPIPGNFSQRPAPPQAIAQATQFSVSTDFDFLGVDTPAPNSVTEIKAILSDDRCVAVSIPAFDSWYKNPAVIESGDIGMPGPEEVAGNIGHSICLIGYFDLPGSLLAGGGRFIVRNSWGERWGWHSKFGPGYGSIPYGFIDAHCSEAFAVLP